MNTDDAMKAAIMQVAQAKVAEAMGGDVLGKMIDAVMNHRDRSTYSRDKESTEFERIVKEHLRHAVEVAVREYLSEHREKIAAAVKAAMIEGGVDKMAASIADAFATDDWRASLNISVERKGD